MGKFWQGKTTGNMPNHYPQLDTPQWSIYILNSKSVPLYASNLSTGKSREGQGTAGHSSVRLHQSINYKMATTDEWPLHAGYHLHLLYLHDLTSVIILKFNLSFKIQSSISFFHWNNKWLLIWSITEQHQFRRPTVYKFQQNTKHGIVFCTACPLQNLC